MIMAGGPGGGMTDVDQSGRRSRLRSVKLHALVRDHPELVGPGGDGVQGWVTTLEGDEAMAADTEQVAFRLPRSLVESLDAYAVRLAKEQAGMTFTRTYVVRILLTRALETEPASKPKRAPSRRR